MKLNTGKSSLTQHCILPEAVCACVIVALKGFSSIHVGNCAADEVIARTVPPSRSAS